MIAVADRAFAFTPRCTKKVQHKTVSFRAVSSRSFGVAARLVAGYRLSKAVLLTIYIVGLNKELHPFLPDSYPYSYRSLFGQPSLLPEASTCNINSFNRFRCKRSFHG